MTDIDTSPDAVEAIAERMDYLRLGVFAALLRQLAKERDEALAALSSSLRTPAIEALIAEARNAALEEAEARVRVLEKMDREAATHVESVICMMSNRFTGNPPYVGWKGLGRALQEDYNEMNRLRADLEKAKEVLRLLTKFDDVNSLAIARITLSELENSK